LGRIRLLARLGIFIALLEVDLEKLKKSRRTLFCDVSHRGLGTMIGVVVFLGFVVQTRAG